MFGEFQVSLGSVGGGFVGLKKEKGRETTWTATYDWTKSWYDLVGKTT